MATESKNKAYKAIRSEELSKSYQPRFVIVNTETGEILDDAQGYGYKTPQKAYAAWSYKNRTPEQKSKASKIESWLRKNKQFTLRLDECSWYAYKDMVDITSKDVELILRSCEKEGVLTGEIPGTAAEIFRAWKSGNYRRRRQKKR